MAESEGSAEQAARRAEEAAERAEKAAKEAERSAEVVRGEEGSGGKHEK